MAPVKPVVGELLDELLFILLVLLLWTDSFGPELTLEDEDERALDVTVGEPIGRVVVITVDTPGCWLVDEVNVLPFDELVDS